MRSFDSYLQERGETLDALDREVKAAQRATYYSASATSSELGKRRFEGSGDN